MAALKRLYERSDTWLRGLARGAYAVILGLSAGIGVLIVGLLFSRERLRVQALTMAFVMVGLEYAFGKFQETET